MNLKLTLSALTMALMTTAASATEVQRYAGGPTSPIAAAVEISNISSIVFESGKTPIPKNREAKQFSVEYWGNTEEQTISVLTRIKDSLESKGMSMGDIVKLTVFLVGVPELDGKMDRAGFSKGYSQFFGTTEQPNLPARSTIQIAALGSEGMWVEIEAIAVRK